jgi:UDP-N-acetylmuramoyl-tripeptide--D-alanyl-D-alanine ligase
VEVENSHEAMMLLAEKYRDGSDARFVGITGSNGKTTTKEMTYRLVSAVEDKAYRSPGNFNNLFGMPLALFGMPGNVRVAIMEMGISIPGEMARLTRIVRPEVIVITNVGPSHLQFLDSVEGVAHAKLEMVRESSPSVPVIINADNPVLVNETGKLRDDVITFGIDSKATYMPDRIETEPGGMTTVVIEGNTFRLSLFGRYQVYNLLAAYAAFRTLGYSCNGIETEDISFETAPMRGETIIRESITFVADCYNANPDSVQSGLLSFDRLPSDRRRVIILGDMLELGKDEEDYHRDIGARLKDMKFDSLVLVGSLSQCILEAAIDAGVDERIISHYEDAPECVSRIRDHLKGGDLVFIKGSRGIGLERILNAFAANGGQN